MKICTRCIMDTTSTRIFFDEKGICNFCKDYEDVLYKEVYRYSSEEHAQMLSDKIEKIKSAGKGNAYDCILGISGGIDSAYLCFLAKTWGLRPLVVHFDNGWNTDTAVTNIKNVIKRTGFDLYTYVINWDQFKDLQTAYFKASVLDIEVPNDQLIFAVLFKVAREKGIKNIISGNNIFTEQILPDDWAFKKKFDLTNLLNIHKAFGKSSIRDFPTLSISDRNKYELMGYKIQTVFEHLPYEHEKIKDTLIKEFDFQFYESKHAESLFTRFYQGYILPAKWNIDKRKAHLSCLIMVKAITREQALKEILTPPYPFDAQQADKAYVIKKWELTEKEFDLIMHTPPVPHENYGFDRTPFYQVVLKKIELIYKYQVLKRLGFIKPIQF